MLLARIFYVFAGRYISRQSVQMIMLDAKADQPIERGLQQTA